MNVSVVLTGRVAIVGGGIGGLATALALRGLGYEVSVFERAPHRTRQGVAVLMWANAIVALGKLGVRDAVLAKSSVIATTEVRAAAGRLLSSLPVGAWSDAAGAPTVAVRRADVVDALAAGVPRVTYGVGFSAFEERGDGVDVLFSDGSRERFDMLIGADGLMSAVRAQLLGDTPPRSLGQDAYVGLATGYALPAGVATATIGRGPRFWSCALTGGDAFWYATVPPGESPRRAFAGWHAPIGALLDATREDDVVLTHVRDREPCERWGRGRVTLVGDAAHPATPDLGQGACQAIESAVVLASCLARAGGAIEAGLRAYEAMRIPRTATIARMCWLTAINSTTSSAATAGVRDLAIQVGLKPVAHHHLAWMLAGQTC